MEMKEEKIDMTSLEALKFFYNNSALTEYLQALSDEELNEAYLNIVVDHIDSVKKDILDAIYQEKEYRKDSRFMNDNESSKTR